MEQVRKIALLAACALSLFWYYQFAHTYVRWQHFQIFLIFTLLFATSVLIVKELKSFSKTWIWILGIGLAFRLMFLFVTPHLSDDYFRFTWDGELQKDGISVFAFVPKNHAEFFADKPEMAKKYEKLFKAHSDEFPNGMNSKGYYSIYPAVNQFVYTTSGAIGSPNENNLIIMRIWMLIAEITSFFLLRALLLQLNLAENLIGLYWLNPLVIIELTGNLHFEGFAITFILLALYYLGKKKVGLAGAALALAISTKINPLFMVGAVFRKLSTKQFILFGLVTGLLTVLVCWDIFQPENFVNFKSSVGLYFAHFGFNAGILYFIRDCYEMAYDKNITDVLSVLFPFISMALMAFASLSKRKSVHHKLLVLFLIYFSFSPIVHPWYILMMLPLGILSKKLYPILWSFMIFCTYSAYGLEFGESNAIIFTEFGLLYLMMFLEYTGMVKPIEKFKKFLFT